MSDGDEFIELAIRRRPPLEVLIETWDKLEPRLHDLLADLVPADPDALGTLGLMLTLSVQVAELRQDTGDVPVCVAHGHDWTRWTASADGYRRRCQRQDCPGMEVWHWSAGVPS